MGRGRLVWLALVTAALLVACAAATKPAVPIDRIAQNDPADAGADADDDDDAETTEENATADADSQPSGPCPSEMVLVENGDLHVCIDRWEASLVEVDADGNEKPYPHWLPVDGHNVRAVSVPDVFPQGYISELQADDACAASHKRLCNEVEWMTTCAGPAKTTFPYGDARRPDACHDNGKSAVGAVFGAQMLASAPAPPPKGRPVHKTEKKAASTTKTRPSKKKAAPTPKKKGGKPPPAAKSSARPSSVDPWVWQQLNDPRLGQVEGALAKTGSHEDCTNTFGAFDMMGNIHEWVKTSSSAPHGTFCGGYYLDTSINGDGCKYRTRAHAHEYHDYSTGFRCCTDPNGR